jgi:hypothetical protein
VTTFGRLGRVLFGAGVVFAVLFVVSLATFDSQAARIAFGVLAAVDLVNGAVFMLVQRRLFGSPHAVRRAEREGRVRGATITEVRGTSGRINGNAIVRLAVRLDGRTYDIRTVAPFDKGHALQVGASLPIKVDPGGTDTCVVAWDAV